MRVLLIPSSYPPVLGGLQTAVHTLARGLVKQQHEAHVFTNRYPRSLRTHDTVDGVSVDRRLLLTPRLADLKQARPDLLFSSFYYFPATLLHLKAVMKSFRPDVVNVHFPDAQIPFVLALRRRRNFRLVVSLHGHDVERWFTTKNGHTNGANKAGSPQQKQRLQSFLKQADAITACSNDLLSKARALQPEIETKSSVIYNGVELQFFQGEARYRHARPYIFSYGRFTFKKGFDLLLSAFAEITKRDSNVDLILAGEGEEFDRLATLSRELGIAERVKLFGRASSAQIAELLNGSLFVVVPSRQEPFGLVALEAMAAGKAVVASRAGGLREVLKDAEAILVEPNQSAELATAIEAVLQRISNEPALGSRNRREAARFSTNRMIENYLDVYSA